MQRCVLVHWYTLSQVTPKRKERGPTSAESAKGAMHDVM